MERKHIVYGFIIFLGVALIFNFVERQRETASLAMAPQLQEETTVTLKPGTPESPSPSPMKTSKKTPSRSVSSISPNEIRNLRSTLPDKEDVKEETRNNPHRTPESLVKFATAMGPLMEKAYINDQSADILIKELHNCATDATVAKSARALCVSNAQKIAKTHPDMKDKADQIRASVDPGVTDILKKRELLMKK